MRISFNDVRSDLQLVYHASWSRKDLHSVYWNVWPRESQRVCISFPVWTKRGIVHGCQMAIAGSLDRMCLALRATGQWLRYAMLQNVIPSFPWIKPGWRAWGRKFCHLATMCLSDRVISFVPEDCREGGAGHELREVAELLAVKLVLRSPARPPHGHRLKERERQDKGSLLAKCPSSLATFFHF